MTLDGQENSLLTFAKKYPFTGTDSLEQLSLRDSTKFAFEVVDRFGGESFGSGLFSILTPTEMEKIGSATKGLHVLHKGEFHWFARNWKGNIFCVARKSNPDLLRVCLFDLGSGKLFIVANNIEEYFSELTNLPDEKNGSLYPKDYSYWMQRLSRKITSGECIGHKIPMFMGQDESFDNQEVIDFEVYWHLTFQLMAEHL